MRDEGHPKGHPAGHGAPACCSPLSSGLFLGRGWGTPGPALASQPAGAAVAALRCGDGMGAAGLGTGGAQRERAQAAQPQGTEQRSGWFAQHPACCTGRCWARAKANQALCPPAWCRARREGQRILHEAFGSSQQSINPFLVNTTEQLVWAARACLLPDE